MLEKLQANSDRMRQRLDLLCALFASSKRPDMAQLAELRWELANLGLRHMSMFDRFVLARLGGRKQPDVRETVATFRQQCIDHLRDYGEHVQQWPADRVEQDWQGYRRHGLKQAEMLRVILDLGRDVILPMACPVESAEPMPLSHNWASQGQALKLSIAPTTLIVPAPASR